MRTYTIENKETDSKGSYFIMDEGNTIAEMTYSRAGTDRIIIDHTEVSDNHRGEGLGEKLVNHAVVTARKQKISIVPLCPFSRSVFQKNPDLRDVL